METEARTNTLKTPQVETNSENVFITRKKKFDETHKLFNSHIMNKAFLTDFSKIEKDIDNIIPNLDILWSKHNKTFTQNNFSNQGFKILMIELISENYLKQNLIMINLIVCLKKKRKMIILLDMTKYLHTMMYLTIV